MGITMKRYRFLLAALFAAATFVIGQRWSSAVPPAPEPGKEQAPESLDVRYSRAQLALAQVNLKRVTEMNQKVANLVSADTLISYQQDVKIAEAELAAATSADAAEQFAVWLRRAESAVSYAEVQWRGAVAANQRASGAFSSIDVERRRLRLAMSKLQLERGKTLLHAEPQRQVAWELSVVSDELQRLREELLQTAPSAPVYHVWWP